MGKKGGFRGGGGGGFGGGMNMNMVKQAQKMQAEMEEKIYSAQAGGGAVTAEVSGKRELLSLEIDPDVVDAEDVDMLQDLIIAAVNEALRKAETSMNDSMSQLTGGLNLGF